MKNIFASTLFFSLRLFGLLFFGTVSAQQRPCLLENMFVINEDASHFFLSRTPEQMTLEGLNAFVDQYADTKVTHLFLNPNGSRANFTNPARDAIWQPNSQGIEPTNRWPQNCKLLEEKGLDPYKIWIDRCREKNISPWISIRMNDLHSADDPTNFMHSTFWVTRPELWRVPNDTTKNWLNRALNFKHPEVRKHLTDFIDVIFERYDFDGIELDWMRFGWHLTPGQEAEEGHYLTEVVEYARKKADEWSAARRHPIDLAVRVPADPDAAALLGMDGVAWAKAGLIDLLIPAPFWSTMDFDIPIERWNERLAGTQVALAAAAECNVRAYPQAEAAPCTKAQLYGFAASEKYRGTTNIYLFNWMDCDTLPIEKERYHELLKNGFDDYFLAACAREIPLTYHDTVPSSFDHGCQLPKETKEPALFRILIGPKPTDDGCSGAYIGLAAAPEVKSAQFSATLNGCAARSLSETDAGSIPGAARRIDFEFPLTAFRDGDNELVVTQIAGEPQKIIFVSAKIAANK